MNTDVNPKGPVSDLSAWGIARRRLVELLGSLGRADTILDRHDANWETDINANGVPVRRYVLRGEWEVDPQPPAYVPLPGDVVRFADRRDGRREWTVSPPITPLRAGRVSLISPGADETQEHQYAEAGELEIVRRPR